MIDRDRLWTLQTRLAPYLFVSPFILLFLVFLLYPLLSSVVISLFKSAGPREHRFVGLENYTFLLSDRYFWLAVGNTAYYTAAFVMIQIPAALGLAVLLNSPKVKGRNFFRFAFFSTHLVGQVFVAVLFALLLSPRAGLLNRSIGVLWGRVPEINWLSEPRLVMPAILMAGLWISIGYGMIYFLAALQSVEKELYEAAEVDGAGKWSQFWHVTLPGIRPVLIFMILVGTIGGFQLFELPFVLFQGAGPDSRALTIVMYLYVNGFEAGNLGYAAAVGWLLVLMLLAVSIVQLRITRATRVD